jgi:hypothetical protein
MRFSLWAALSLTLVVGCVDLEPPSFRGHDATSGGQDASVLPKGEDARPDAPPIGPGGTPLENGKPCLVGDQCQSGKCVDGACCESSCASPCHACNMAESAGKCVPAPEGTDLRGDCPRDEPASCQRDGACDGRGGCRLYTATTECAPGACSAATESAARLCDGLGTCRPPASTRSCAPNVCNGSSCGTQCGSNAECQMGFSCSNGACTVTPGRPLLQWSFDETDGSQASDSSGNGFHGVYGGMVGIPTPSLDVPSLKFANPRSRAFVATSRQLVRLSPLPAAFKVSNGVTLTAWFRATSIDSTGYAELISVGDGYLLIMSRAQVAIMKRIAGTTYPWAPASITSHLDGRWHHVAGVASAAGLKLYFDGVERASTKDGTELAYSSTPELVVGRDPDARYGYYFDGNLDEVRVYTRVLTPTEIAALAAGGN